MKRLSFDSIMSKFAVVVDNALIDKYVNDELYESVEKDIIDYFNNNYAYGSNQMTGMLNNPQLPIGMTQEDIQEKVIELIKRLNHEQQQG